MDQRESKNNKVILVGALLIAMVFTYTIFKSGSKGNNSDPAKTKKEETEIKYPKITPEDLRIKLKTPDSIQLVDIRNPEEYKMEHLINSINAVSEESLNAISKEKIIVIIGYEEQKESYKKAIEFYKSKGFNESYALDGGMAAWKEIGGSTISIGNPNLFTDNAKIIYISPEDLKKIIDDPNYSKYVLDVSSKQTFTGGHLPGAENIFLDDLEKSADKITSGKEIFVYGENELQGFQAGVRLYDLGIMNVIVLKGGPIAWKEKGFEVVK